MNCAWLKDTLGFDCVAVTNMHGVPGIEIGTPFSFADGSAITLYAFTEGAHLLLSDNGDTLAHLSAMGLPLKHGKLHALRDRLSRHGLALTEAGEVRMLAPQSQGQHAIASAISALLNVAEWEREQLGVHDHANDLADLAELYLRQWKPGAPLQRHAKIKGQSNKEYTFDYYLDGEYIDIVAANHTATGAALRKAGDIKNSPWLEGRDIRFIIDDRSEPQKAETERQIMGALVKAMMFSRLQQIGTTPVKH